MPDTAIRKADSRNPIRDRPAVTAAIPTFRRPALLKRAVKSVLNQTYENVRVVVSDNASGDETPEVLAKLAESDSRVTYHIQDKNRGPIANFEFVKNQVHTPYFSFLSDDDLLLPHFYDHAIERLSEAPSAKFFCGQVVMLDPDRGTYAIRPRKVWSNGVYQAGSATVKMLEKMFIWTGSVFSKDVRDRVGPFAESGGADIDFLVKAAATFAFVVSLTPVAVFSAYERRQVHTIPPKGLAFCYRDALRSIREQGVVGQEGLTKLRDELREKFKVIIGQRLNRHFIEGDWERFDEAARALRGLRGLPASKRIRMALGNSRSRNTWLTRFVRATMARIKEWKLLRESGGDTCTMDELVAKFSLSARGHAEDPSSTG